jgi:tetratricopeptide (TPR) repeat protein
VFLIADNCRARVKPAELIRKQVNVPVGSQVGDAETIRQRLDDVEAAPTNGAGGTKNGNVCDTFHSTPRILSRYGNGACISSRRKLHFSRMRTAPLHSCLVLLVLAIAGACSQTPDTQAKFRLAQGLEQSGELERAAELYRDLLRSDPRNYAFFDGLHRTAMSLKRYDEAIAVIKARIALFPADVPLHAMLGTALYRGGKERDAMDTWDAALALGVTNVQTYRLVANVLIENRLLDRAADVYRKGRTLSDDPSLFSIELAQLLAATMDYGGATAEYLRWLSRNPAQLGFVQNRMATFSWKPDGRTAAISTVRSGMAVQPDDLRLHELLGWLYLEGKDFVRAFDAYREIDRLSRANGIAILGFADRVFRERAFDVAASAYSEAMQSQLPSQRIPQARYGAACAAKELQGSIDSSRGFTLPGVRPSSESRTRYTGPLATFAAIAGEYPHTEYAVKSLFQIAMIQLRQYFDLDQAQQMLEKVLIESAATPALRMDVRLRLGEIFVARADTIRAAEAFAAVAAAPSATPDQSDEARLRLAELAFFTGRVADAVGILDSISVNLQHDYANDALSLQALLEENNRTDPGALGAYGKAEFRARQHKNSEAIQLFLDLAGRYPRAPLVEDALHRVGALQTEAGMFQEAVSTYDRLLTELREQSRMPDRALFRKAEVLQVGLLRPYDAAGAYERLLVEFPNSVLANAARQRIRFLRGETL